MAGMVGNSKMVLGQNRRGAADTMSVGDLFGRKHKTNSRKAADPPVDAGTKKPKQSSEETTLPTCLVSATANVSGPNSRVSPDFTWSLFG